MTTTLQDLREMESDAIIQHDGWAECKWHGTSIMECDCDHD